MSSAGEILGLEHVDLSVRDVAQSIAFYEGVLGFLGFRRVGHESYTAWSNGLLTLGLREADDRYRSEAFDRTRPGLHHLALKAKERGTVDRLHDYLVREGHPVLDPPALYPQYGSPYYAVFFADPDGMKLEVVHFPWGYWRRVQENGTDSRARG